MGIGTNVRTAKNGAEGLGILRDVLEKSEFPQLILLDINMNGMGGCAFMEELGNLSYVNLIVTKIVLLSDSMNPLDIGLARKLLRASHMQKTLSVLN